jgi:hypothetical protein
MFPLHGQRRSYIRQLYLAARVPSQSVPSVPSSEVPDEIGEIDSSRQGEIIAAEAGKSKLGLQKSTTVQPVKN